ncbi:MAG TPA: hypothetical protein VFT95_01340 [Micromonosporaceae bacterium]|nr:hypothetical protein [Micromonosporaceae bacterium]
MRVLGLRPLLAASLAGTLTAGAALAGCGSDEPSVAAPTASTGIPTPGEADARAQLAARAAAAKDQRYAAMYSLSTGDRPDRVVVVTRAKDGGWRVDVPGGALGGTADVSVARTREGLFQCGLASTDGLFQPACVRVAGRDGDLDGDVDPWVQHIFVDWLEVLTDRTAAIAVSTAKRLRGVRGDCFSVESNSASLAEPLDVGIYCYSNDGLLTGARLGFGTLKLSGEPAAPPSEITLPGPVVDGEPLPIASPPPPPTTAPPDGEPGATPAA